MWLQPFFHHPQRNVNKKKKKSLNIPSSTDVIVDTLVVTAFYLMRGSNYVNVDIKKTSYLYCGTSSSKGTYY